MAQWLEALANVGVVSRLPSETPTYAGELLDIDGVRDRIGRAVRSIDRATSYPGFIEYFKVCISHQTGLLTGRVSAQKLLFPAGSSRIVEGLYRTNPAAAMQNSVAAALIHAACVGWPQSRPLRILELGAGTGATTTAIIAGLPTTELHYRFTDVSRFFIKRAARQFAQHPFVAYDRLDIDRPVAEQGFEHRSFDIIVGANVLHTAKHIDQTLRHVRDLLSDDGIVVAIETTSNTTLQMITFGHFDGVCHFQDHRRLSNLPFLSCSEWQSALRCAGLGNVTAVPSPEARSRSWMQHVVVGARGSV
jgi:yersiniabactin nonribosomal peptide synthetase/pyochelin synthetase